MWMRVNSGNVWPETRGYYLRQKSETCITIQKFIPGIKIQFLLPAYNPEDLIFRNMSSSLHPAIASNSHWSLSPLV